MKSPHTVRIGIASLLVCVTAFAFAPSLDAGEPVFRRGDSNADGTPDISDGVFTLNFLFLGGSAPVCFDAADTNDDGRVDLSDAAALFNYLFLGGAAPPAPGPEECGDDPTDDELGDCEYPEESCEI
jgi:hypothetical protein